MHPSWIVGWRECPFPCLCDINTYASTCCVELFSAVSLGCTAADLGTNLTLIARLAPHGLGSSAYRDIGLILLAGPSHSIWEEGCFRPWPWAFLRQIPAHKAVCSLELLKETLLAGAAAFQGGGGTHHR